MSNHISKAAGVCGGRACITGHRIRVMDIVVLHQLRGYTPDEIVSMFSQLTLADIYAALTYYFDNRAEIDDELAKELELAKDLLTKHPSKVIGKLSA